MPAHKRHHYVPRCYLRPFSPSDNGRTLNVYNLSTGRAIQNAPLKGQCARDYFYGNAGELELEQALQHIEGAYARSIRNLAMHNDSFTHDDMLTIREFMYLQYVRTDIAVKRRRAFYDEFDRVTHEARPDLRRENYISDTKLVIEAIRNYTELRSCIQDLKMLVVKNEGKHGFITSDDPCFFTNRFYIQRVRGSTNFGIGSSGVIFFIPLTPRHMFVCYDGNVYTVPESVGYYVITNKQSDIKALNDLQYIKAAENLYFTDWNDHERLASEFLAVHAHRLESWFRMDVLVQDSTDAAGVLYRRATHEERMTATRTLQVASSQHPRPLRWFSKLRFRAVPKVYYNGTGAGYVRKAEWLGGREG